MSDSAERSKAHQLREAVAALNTAIDVCMAEGLKVEISVLERTPVNRKWAVPHVEGTVLKVV